MSDSAPAPDDLVVSAVLDGMASPDEVDRVASDPRLAARLAAFRAVADAVGGPVPLVDTTVREAHLARALQAFKESRETTPVAAVPPPPLAAPPPPPAAPSPPPSAPVDLATARARRHRPRSTTILSIAAAVVLVVAAGAFLVRVSDSAGTGGDDTAASSSDTRESSAEDSGAAAGGEDQAFVPEASTGTAAPESADGNTPTTTAGDSATSSGVDPSLPSVGTFTKASDLADRVRGELVLNPRPEGFATDEACADDFGVDVALLGRATVDGQEGLVYVEAAPGSGRRLWLVDPGTVGADDACRQVVPVQRL